MMNQKKLKRIALALLLLCPLGVQAGDKPNVLFIICDDLNTHVSTSGYSPIETPAFDQLAAAGMSFDRAYCQYPVCGPSRASFLHGLYPQSTGIVDNNSDIREQRSGTISMPQAFKDGGYWTASTGKIFHNAKVQPGDLCWDEFVKFTNDEMPIEAEARKAFEAENGSITERKNRKKWKAFLPTVATQTRGQQPGYGPSGLEDAQHSDGKNAGQVRQWIKNESYGDKPFFIALGIQKPHVPFLAPEAYFEKYPLDQLQFEPALPSFWKQAPKTAMVKRHEGFGFEFEVENEALRREYIQAYHACISFIDAQIGSVFASLKENGLWEDTIIVLSSDHGYQLGEHFMWGKVTLFEVCARVPMLLRVPGMTQPGSSSQGLVEMIDLYPTLAELCEVKRPMDLQGQSLVPMLKNPQTAGKEVVYTVVSRGENLGKAIRTQRWRYAVWADGEELYDLQEDIMENRNLARNEAFSDRLQTMRSLMKVKMEEAGSRRQPSSK